MAGACAVAGHLGEEPDDLADRRASAAALLPDQELLK
jgi:hypothetical protein